MVIDRPNVDSLLIYIPQAFGNYKIYAAGNFSVKSNLFRSTNFVFELPPASGPQTVWVRLRTTNIVLMPLKVVTGPVIVSAMLQRTLFEATYGGMLVLLFLISLLLFFRVKERVYLYYAGYVFCLIAYILLYHRGYSHVLGLDFNGIFGQCAYIFALIGYICAALFADRFLDMQQYSPRLHQTLLYVIGAIVVSILLSFFLSPYFGVAAVQFFGLVQTVVLLISGIVIYRKGISIARYYTLAWGSIMAALLYMLISFQGWIPFEDFTYQALALGSTLELSLLAVALSDRIRLQSKQKEKAVRDYNLLQEKSRRELEYTVAARTTDLQLTLETLNKEKEQKDDLFRIVMHDVRSPVANLYQLMQLIESGGMDNEELKTYVPLLKTDTGRVLDTMGMLLQWSMLNKEGATSKFEEIELASLLHDHAAMYQQLTTAKDICVSVSCSTDAKVFTDRNHLSLVLRNLIDNAIKFTPREGSIRIRHEASEKSDRICVFNTAAPLSESLIEELHARSGLHLSTGTAKEKGVGLGLQLCREFLTKMNSKLEVKNVEGGVEFCFVLI
jgi:signal transduction histidine kinase